MSDPIEEEIKEEPKLDIEVPKEILEESEAKAKDDEEKEITDPADTEETGDDKEVDPNTPVTDIVFPEDSILSEEQQSGFSEILGSQENYDKVIAMLQDISSAQAEKGEAEAVATAEAKSKANEETLKKDPEFGPNYEPNTKAVADLAKEIGLPEAVDLKDPQIAKALFKVVNERSDADVHIENNKPAPTGPKKDIYGKPVMEFDKTLEALKERK